MKHTISSTIAVLLAVFSCSAFADKIALKGEPVVIEKRGEIYYVPDSYRPTTDYYYVSTEGVNRVCYKEKQPNLRIDASLLDVSMGGERASWHCYNYDETIFEVQP